MATTVSVYQTISRGAGRALSDGSAVVVQTYVTDEFGVRTASNGRSAQPFQYTGERRDAETGLVYLRTRLSDSAGGRFVSTNPPHQASQGILGWNRYIYVGDNLATFRGPSELQAEQECLACESHWLLHADCCVATLVSDSTSDEVACPPNTGPRIPRARQNTDRGRTTCDAADTPRSRSPAAQALVAWRPPPPPKRGRCGKPSWNLRLCLRRPAELKPDERVALEQSLAEGAPVARAHDLLHRFRQLITDRDSGGLDGGLGATCRSDLPPFVGLAEGKAKDWAAVEAAGTTVWSTGPAEGHVQRIKLSKWQGHGRAKGGLLRARLLTAAWGAGSSDGIRRALC